MFSFTLKNSLEKLLPICSKIINYEILEFFILNGKQTNLYFKAELSQKQKLKHSNILSFPTQRRGSYGVVYLGQKKDNIKIKRAIKKLSKNKIRTGASIINEINIVKQLDHPCITRLYETFEDQNYIYLVMDLCEGKQLFDHLELKGQFSQKDARDVFLQMVEAINYCHSLKIVHRDLKPQNFLFIDKKSLNLKLIDFGLSFQWKDNIEKQLIDQKQNNKIAGTCYYIAPQVFTHDYDERCDIWSLGVILYILVTSVPPFDGKDQAQIMKSVRKGEYNMNIPEMKEISKNCQDLIKRLLQPKQNRISVKQIFQHPWIKQQCLNMHPLKLDYKKIYQFTELNKLQTLTAAFLASQISESDIKNLVTLFKQMDTNHDGFIDRKQLKQQLIKQKIFLSEQQIDKLINRIDTDKNGQINYNQFITCNLPNQVLEDKQNLYNVFKSLDKNGDGSVQREELKQILVNNKLFNESKTVKDLEDIFEEFDINKDGKIDFEQFLNSIKL